MLGGNLGSLLYGDVSVMSRFCHSNIIQDVDFWVGYGSCCKDCFCDEQCGERMDCCWDYLDDTKIVETNELTCITPVTQP